MKQSEPSEHKNVYFFILFEIKCQLTKYMCKSSIVTTTWWILSGEKFWLFYKKWNNIPSWLSKNASAQDGSNVEVERLLASLVCSVETSTETELRCSWCSDTGWPLPEETSSPGPLPLFLCLPAACSLHTNKTIIIMIKKKSMNKIFVIIEAVKCFNDAPGYLLPLRHEFQELYERRSVHQQETIWSIRAKRERKTLAG